MAGKDETSLSTAATTDAQTQSTIVWIEAIAKSMAA